MRRCTYTNNVHNLLSNCYFLSNGLILEKDSYNAITVIIFSIPQFLRNQSVVLWRVADALKGCCERFREAQVVNKSQFLHRPPEHPLSSFRVSLSDRKTNFSPHN